MKKKYNVWLILEEMINDEEGIDIEAIKIGRFETQEEAFMYLTELAEREDSERDYVI